MVLPPERVQITNPEFSSLSHTSRKISAQCSCYKHTRTHMFILLSLIIVATRLCGIKAVDLVDQPDFTTVFSRFVKWMVNCLNQAQQSGTLYYPGSCIV